MLSLLQLANALLFAVLPGMACVLWLPRGGIRWPARLGAGLALSPAIGGTVIAVLMLGGLEARRAALVLLVAAALSVVLAVARRRTGARVARTAEARTLWWFCLVCVALVAALPTFAEWWRIYSDAWTHAGIARAIEVLGVPPNDPGFAGAPLQYAWIYHAFVAGAHALTGIDRYVFMVLLQSFALAAVILGVGSAVPRTGGSSIGWTLALLVLGLNALFPLFIPLLVGRAFTGEVRGVAELTRQFELLPLEWDRSGIFLRTLWGQDYFLDKFMVATPFALALGAFAAWLGSVRRFLEDNARYELIFAALLTFGAGLMHPVVGLHMGASTGLLFVAQVLDRNRGRPLAGRVFRLGLAVFAGLLPIVLYTATIMGGAGGTHSEFPADIGPQKILGYVSCLGLGLVFAWKPAIRMWRARDTERAWVMLLVAGLVIALTVRLPGPSAFFTVDKFSYLVWIPLVITAGPAFADFLGARSGAMRIAIALLLFLPVNGLVFASRIADPHNHFEQPWDRPVYSWIRSHTPDDAILLTPSGDWETAQFSERDQYYSVGHAAVQLGYEITEIEARAALVRRLFEEGRLTADDHARLRALGRPVYIVWTDFREPIWQMTPGLLTRLNVPLGPKPAFDASFPLLLAANDQEIRGIAWPDSGGPDAASDARIAAPDSLDHHP